jgi:uncharacterized protein (DUF1786 family)
MSGILTVDVGAGTMDILHVDAEREQHFKAVIGSPVAVLARQVEASVGDLLILGSEMGGGAVSKAVRERARDADVVMSRSASRTIHHDVERVRSQGVRVIEDDVAEAMAREGMRSVIEFTDLPIDRLRAVVAGFGVPFSFDLIGVCAQDHGVPSGGDSHLDHRHHHFRRALEATPFPHALLHRDDEIPSDMTRLQAIAETAESLPCGEVYVMDSGMAAILGASTDPRVVQKENALVLDIATSHTVGAALQGEELAGFFEYHTRDITLERLEALLVDLANGDLSHEGILAEGGHGAFVRTCFGFENAEVILATGPKRALLEPSRLPIELGAPLGDNMMTGTAGLLEAIRRRRKLAPLPLRT